LQIEGKVPNPGRVLTPGMFVNVAVDAGAQKRYLTLPQTAVVYNPYGETVFVVQKRSEAEKAEAEAAAQVGDPPAEPNNTGRSGTPQAPTSPDDLVVRQVFVSTGPTRGDQVAILKGLSEGAVVVTSGQIKLKNGAQVSIDNRVLPADNPNPTPQEQ
jgi:membrane fusion protein, multidrug efflux system